MILKDEAPDRQGPASASGSSVLACDEQNSTRDKHSGEDDKHQSRESITATLVVKRTPPKPGRRNVYFYDVRLDGEIIVKNSADPEFDLARALLARGIVGCVKIVDAVTGQHRSTLPDIAKAAGYCTREGPLRFKAVRRLDRPCAAGRPEARQ